MIMNNQETLKELLQLTDSEQKVRYIDNLTASLPESLIINSEQEKLDCLALWVNALKAENDPNVVVAWTTFLNRLVCDLDQNTGTVKLKNVSAVLPQMERKSILYWLEVFAANGDKSCLGAVKSFFDNENEEIRQAARAAFTEIAGSDPADREAVKANRAAQKEINRIEAEQRAKEREERLLREAPINTINEEEKTIDIIAKGMYPANVLSNYHRVDPPFYIDGMECYSIEGFLQALKFQDIEMQKRFCLLSGATAHHQGNHVALCTRWHRDQTLYWLGTAYPRCSEEYCF